MFALADVGRDGLSMFGVFDGHGGKAVSNFVKAHIADVFAVQLKEKNEQGLPAVLAATFHAIVRASLAAASLLQHSCIMSLRCTSVAYSRIGSIRTISSRMNATMRSCRCYKMLASPHLLRPGQVVDLVAKDGVAAAVVAAARLGTGLANRTSK